LETEVLCMVKPALLIMAAGLGSRYGGLKQLAPVDEHGQSIIDFSIYDALRAGFERVVCVIAPGMEADFHSAIGRRMAGSADLKYVEQRLDKLPGAARMPAGRVRPWGTAHAVWCARGAIDGPFSAINADDFYGETAFAAVCRALQGAGPFEHVMAGYRVENTLTENGAVSRGVCSVKDGFLSGIVERFGVRPASSGAVYAGPDKTLEALPAGTVVSMNMWGFAASMMDAIEAYFEEFLAGPVQKDPLKSEYYLPYVVNRLIEEGRALVRVLPCAERWYGVTYMEDLPGVRSAVAQMKQAGRYPDRLWPFKR
jgi:hypothetical protein